MTGLFDSLPSRKFQLSALALGSAGALAILLPRAMHTLFSTPFLPHAYCYLFNRPLITLHVASDGVIWLSYMVISITLMYMVQRARREIPFSWMFLAFGVFIISCGFTHLMEMIVLYQPLYWLSGAVKVITAIASVTAAIALPPQLPIVHQMIVDAKISEQRRLTLERTNEELFQTNLQLRGEMKRRIAAEESLRQLSGSLLHAQDNERRRIARELHDSVGQLLSGAVLSVSAFRRKTRRLSSKSTRLLSQCTDCLTQSLSEIRTISYLLHPPMLDETGLADTLRWYARGFAERSGVQVELDISDDADHLSRDLRTAVFRIVQESLTNIQRHAESASAEIHLRRAGAKIELRVRDHGKGMPPESLESYGRERPMHGVGIRGMRERVVQLDGEMSTQSSSSGTVVEVVLPFREQSRDHHLYLSGADSDSKLSWY
ncbi:MAG TPA: histidine kinase [Terriglobales bacterium]